jgi:anaerobic magnesium-protoporphyrin IX monomethyl ester cyclase
LILIAHSFFLQHDPKQLERSKPYPPLTTLLAAAILRAEGHSVELFDATFEAGPEAFELALVRAKPAIVLLIEDNFNFLTKMCTENRRADALAMVRAAARHGCQVAVNGPDAQDNPGYYLEAGATAVIQNEGEFAAAALVRAFGEAMPALGELHGLTIRGAEGLLRRTGGSRARPDLDTLPLPAWDLLDVDAYRARWRQAHGYVSWNAAASRGCPYRCNWCAKPTFGRGYTQRSAGSVADELAQLKAGIGPDHIWFADDIFGMTAEWIEQFADAVHQRDAVIPFTIQSRANLMTAPVTGALARAGADEVWLGIESGSQRVLDAMDKGSRVDMARSATRNLRAAGIRVGWFLQLGYPPEDWDDILLTRDLVRQEAPDEVGVSVAYPLPGTPFHDRIVAELGPRRNWRDTAELAMLFEGTFDTVFYRMVRDALHAEVATDRVSEALWRDLAWRADAHRTRADRTRLSA